MRIIINNKEIETLEGETLLEAARRAGFNVPSLCYAKEAKHISSCMVCAVKNCQNGQIIPSCTTLPTEGMRIDTESEEVKKVQTLSLELLLSDHRADCEAPCVMVCPKGLDIERMLRYYDEGELEKAYSVLAEAFDLPTLGCDDCKAPCEKVCRRGTVDKGVEIRSIIRTVTEKAQPATGLTDDDPRPDKTSYLSRLGRFTPEEMLGFLRYKSRDNSRTPMQWDSSENAGFTTGKPWIMVNPNYKEINAAEQLARPDSVFHFYQELIRLRHEHKLIVYGSYELLLPEDRQIFAYTRSLGEQSLLCVVNLSGEAAECEIPAQFAGAQTLIKVGEPGINGTAAKLQPWDAFVLAIL